MIVLDESASREEGLIAIVKRMPTILGSGLSRVLAR